MAKSEEITSSEIFKAVAAESDRGCVLVAAAWMDDLLRDIVWDAIDNSYPCGAFVVPDKERNSLKRAVLDGSLGRSSSRINFCRVAGIFDAPTTTALTALLQLRNDNFAHFAGVSRLSDPKVKQRLEEFTSAAKDSQETFTYDQESQNLKKHSRSRIDFMFSFHFLMISVLQARKLFLECCLARRKGIAHSAKQPRKQRTQQASPRS
jgi:hypothetical protein